MKTNDHRELWDDTLADSLPAGFEDEALAKMLGRARTRRRTRTATKGVLILALLTPLLVITHRPAPTKDTPVVTIPHQPSPPSVAPEPAIQVLSDEELFAQFPDRPIAIIGTGDSKQLVFLDQK